MVMLTIHLDDELNRQLILYKSVNRIGSKSKAVEKILTDHFKEKPVRIK